MLGGSLFGIISKHHQDIEKEVNKGARDEQPSFSFNQVRLCVVNLFTFLLTKLLPLLFIGRGELATPLYIINDLFKSGYIPAIRAH